MISDSVQERELLTVGKACVVLVDDSAFTEEGAAKLKAFFEQAAFLGCAGFICVGEGSLDLLGLAEEATGAFWIDNDIEPPEGQIYLALEVWESGNGAFLEVLLARFAEVVEFRCTSDEVVSP